jgi:CRISPR-associated protein Cas1
VAVLYVCEQGAVLRKSGERVIVQKKGAVLGDIPCLTLDTVLLFGNIQVTTQALRKMLGHGIEVALFSRSGKLHGQLTPPKAKNIVLRLRQYETMQDRTAALAMARTVVCGKVRNAAAVLDGMGFDPYIGFYHQIDYGRPSLALDLLEEFRAPLIDRFSAALFNLGVLKAEDFIGTPEKGVLLCREALKRYFVAYEKELTTPVALEGEKLAFRQLFRRQAERLARSLSDGVPYEPFRWSPS